MIHCVCCRVPGEILGDVLSVMHSPEGLRQLVNLPAGSAEAELGGLLPLIQVYHYLEITRSWAVLGADIQRNSADLRQKIRQGEETLILSKAREVTICLIFSDVQCLIPVSI